MQQGIGSNAASSPLNWIRTGRADASTVLFIHAVGFDLTYWDRQIEALLPSYSVVALDLPGHGRSPGQARDLSFPNIAAAIAGLVEELGNGPIHLVGVSFGSLIAQTIVLAYPALIRSLTLIGSASSFPEPTRAAMRARAETTRNGGMEAVLQSSLERWFTPETRRRRPDLVDRVSKTILGDDAAVHAAIWEIIADFDVHARLSEIQCPTLVLVGERDPSTPPAAAAALAEGIRGAKMVVFHQTSHMVQLEAPDAVNRELQHFLSGL